MVAPDHTQGNGHTAYAVQAAGLSKWYGYVMGLNEVSLDIAPGVTALLGPNGAGKSTFMKLVTGQLRPNQGTMRVFGRDPWNRPGVLERIGYCSERDAIFSGLSGQQFVEWTCRLRGLTGQDVRDRAAAALDRFGLTYAAQRKVGGYSKGMRQRVRLASVDALDLDLYILDEPTTGTDPVVREQIVGWVRDLGDSGKTVLVSSHNLAEVEQMTDRLILILGGRVRATGAKRDILELLESGVVTMRIECERPRALAVCLLERPDVFAVRMDGEDWLAVTAQSGSELYARLPELAAACDAGMRQLVAPETSLAGLFRVVTGRR